MTKRFACAPAIVLVHVFELLQRQVLGHRDSVLGALHRNDQFGELELQRHGVAVLGMLKEKDHQEGDDRGRGIDDELPSIAVPEQGSGHGPDDDHKDGDQKGKGLTRVVRSLRRQLRKQMRLGCFAPDCVSAVLSVRGGARRR